MVTVTKDENYRWHLKRLMDAETEEQLDAVTMDIEYDKWEEMEWTKDSVKMSNMGHRWQRAKARISSPKT